jgi:hypothetical protein
LPFSNIVGLKTTSTMCKFVTHLRVCFVCASEDTVLISEEPCPHVRRAGAFGSCGCVEDSGAHRTKHCCWGCKERLRAARMPPIAGVGAN